jgi:PAS domain-containing protein
MLTQSKINLSDLKRRVLDGRPSGVACTERLAELDLAPFDPDEPSWEDELRLGALLLLEGELDEALELIPASHSLHSLVRAFQGQKVEVGHPLAVALSAPHPPKDIPEHWHRPGSFFESLSILCCLRVYWDWVQWAPGPLEAQVQQKLAEGKAWLDKLSLDFPVLLPRIYFEKSQYLAYRDQVGECTAHIQKLLSLPLVRQQLSVVQQARELLGHLDDPQYNLSLLPPRPDGERLGQWQRFRSALAHAPDLLDPEQVSSLKQLREQTLVLLSQVFGSHQIFWLEQEDGHWQCPCYRGPAGFRFWSDTLIQRAAAQKSGFIYQRQTEETQRSIILSEARSVMICSVDEHGDKAPYLYLSHHGLDGNYSAEDLELLEFLVDLVSHQYQRVREKSELEEKLWFRAQSQREYLDQHQSSGLAAAWLDETGRWQSYNERFVKLIGYTPELQTSCSDLFGLDPVAWLDFWELRETGQRQLLRASGPQQQLRVYHCRFEKQKVDPWHFLVIEDAQNEIGPEILMMLEQDRHRLAADLHDGPAQTLAAMRLRLGDLTPEEGRAVEQMVAETLEVLTWFRSPMEDGIPFDRAVRAVFQQLLPEVSVKFEFDVDYGWSPATVALYRCLQDLGEHLSSQFLGSFLQVRIQTVDGIRDSWLVCELESRMEEGLDSAVLQHIQDRLSLVQGVFETLPIAEDGLAGWRLKVLVGSTMAV